MPRTKLKRMRASQTRYGVNMPLKIYDWLETISSPTAGDGAMSAVVDNLIESSLFTTPLPLKKHALKIKKKNLKILLYLSERSDLLIRLVAFHTGYCEEEIILNVLFDLYCLNRAADSPYERSLLITEFNHLK